MEGPCNKHIVTGQGAQQAFPALPITWLSTAGTVPPVTWTQGLHQGHHPKGLPPYTDARQRSGREGYGEAPGLRVMELLPSNKDPVSQSSVKRASSYAQLSG